MADFPRTLAHLDGAALGVFGAGHLGRVIAAGLVQNGFPTSRLLICHGGSPETEKRLAEAGLSGRRVEAVELTRRSRIILYLVRPQHLNAIEHCRLKSDTLFLSFLAGTPLARVPVSVPPGNMVRVMTSAPDTFTKRIAVGGTYPSGNHVAEELLRALHVEQFSLAREQDMHAFTALGVCLPIVLACWRAQEKAVDEAGLIQYAQRLGLVNYERILEWARRAEPRFDTQAEREEYIQKAATPGGVTEAMIRRIVAGGSLIEALESGILRSQELGRGSAAR